MRNILTGALAALLFSAFIYFEEYSLTNELVNALFGLASLALFLHIPKRSVLIAGFFIGLLWFYWIGYSFQYQGVGYMTPLVTLGFGVVYSLFFGVLALSDKVYVRAILLFALSFVEPFDFNWLQIELIFVDSPFGIFKYQLAIVLLALSLPSYVNKTFKYLPLVLLIFAVDYGSPLDKKLDLKIKLVSTDVKQEDKWNKRHLTPIVEMALKEINVAIKEGYDVVILPESVFPLYLNRNPALIDSLLNSSKKITIVAGALLSENGLHYNVTYSFENGSYEIAKKMVLVPFGEYIPLPKFAQDFINDTFFSGASDFVTADKPTDFTIKGVKFRNAICYEATCQEIYEGEVDYVIAMSNNAWFAPSIEPTLQKLLMKYYARKNGVTIYHAANWKGTGIIK